MPNPKVWYTSDTHVGHRLVSGLRGFWPEGIEERRRGLEDFKAHDRALALHWDTTVAPEDHVFLLGDFSIRATQYDWEWFSNRPGNIHLITGNHDPMHPSHRDSYKHYDKWLQVFASIQPFLRRKLVGVDFLMSHFPYTGTGSEGSRDIEERNTQYRLPDLGIPLLHGHTHGPEKEHLSDRGTPQLHVGLDAWEQKLIPQETVIEWIESLIERKLVTTPKFTGIKVVDIF